jgi:predicted SAM-dependent methyltransferase
VLKPGGTLVVTTPNADSLCHKLFKDAWLDLDPPRHLYVFSARSIRSCADNVGIKVTGVKTCSRLANSRWFASMLIKQNGRIPNFRLPIQNFEQQMQAKIFHIFEYVLSRYRNVGEEVVLIGTK